MQAERDPLVPVAPSALGKCIEQHCVASWPLSNVVFVGVVW